MAVPRFSSDSEASSTGPNPETTSEPIPWEVAQRLCSKHHQGDDSELGLLQRSPEMQREYVAALAQIKKEFASVADYLLTKVYGARTQPGPDGMRLVAEPLDPTERLVVIRPNDFQYHFEEGVEHWVLWASQPLSKQEIEEQIGARFSGLETVYWVNPPALQSVKALWHAHVLVRGQAA